MFHGCRFNVTHTHKISNSEPKLPNLPGRTKNTNRLELTYFTYLQRTHWQLEQRHLLLLCEEDGTPTEGTRRGTRFLTTGAGYSTVKIQHHQWASRLLHSVSWAQRTHHFSFSRAHFCVIETVFTFNSFPQHLLLTKKGIIILCFSYF